MALDLNAVKMLLWAKNLGVSFEKVATLGRLGLVCSHHQLQRAVRDFGFPCSHEEIDRCLHRPPMGTLFAEEFLRFLGAKEVISIDYSDFEGATMLHDFNKPFPRSQQGRFTLVLDGGTLEHVFDYPAALRNCLELVCNGGHFITQPPANNHMGHGFYQLSPELFFRVFSAENGFALRKMVLHESAKTDAPFYQVNDPAYTGYRTELVSNKPMSLIALAQRTANVPMFAKPPLQSDYVAIWEQQRENSNSAKPKAGLVRRIRTILNSHWPFWLRHRKQLFFHRQKHGAPKLGNQRHFRLLSRKEILNERFQSQDV